MDWRSSYYIHWKSCYSPVKLGVLKGLIHRAHLLCDLKDDLLDELNLLRNVFVSNGYPYKLVNKTVNESWSSELKKCCWEFWRKRWRQWIFWSTTCTLCSRFHRKFTERAKNIWDWIWDEERNDPCICTL